MASACGSRATLATKLVPRASMGGLPQLLRGIERRRDDRYITGAAAQVAAEKAADIRLVRRRMLAQGAIERHQDAGRAEPALQRVMAAECLLLPRQPAGLRLQSFDGAQPPPVGLHRQGE